MGTARDYMLERTREEEAAEARAERVAERRDALLAERMQDEQLVADALGDFIGYDDAGDDLMRQIARFQISASAATCDQDMIDIGRELRDALRRASRPRILLDAETDAEHDEYLAEQAAADAQAECLAERAA